MQDTTATTKQYQCRHIFTDGRRCASPCLRQQEFCYYHHTTRRPIANPRQRRRRCSTFHLPLPEDRSAIQSSIGEVLQRIASNDIDPRRAGLLLYGLQIASLNLPKTQPKTKTAPEPQTVEEITIDPALGVLAPRAEVGQNERRQSSVTLLLERMMQEDEEDEKNKKDEKDEKEKTASSEPAIIPTLHATAHSPATLPVIRQCSATRSHERSSRKGCDDGEGMMPFHFDPPVCGGTNLNSIPVGYRIRRVHDDLIGWRSPATTSTVAPKSRPIVIGTSSAWPLLSRL